MSVQSIGTTMGNRRGRDPAPQMVPAGIRGRGRRAPTSLEASAVFPRGGEGDVPPTPEGVRECRASHLSPLGRAAVPFGSRHDPPRNVEVRYGVQGDKGQSVADCLKPSETTRLNAIAAEQAERRYWSSRHEPLGRVPDAPYEIPARLQREGFGRHTAYDVSARDVMYPGTDRGGGEDRHPVGEARLRHYDWATSGINPQEHRFGKVHQGDTESTKSLLAPSTTLPLCRKVVHDFATTHRPQLGTVRNLGFGDRDAHALTTYGRAGNKEDGAVRQAISSWNAREREESRYRLGDDINLGQPTVRSHTLRKLKEQGENEDGHVFGVPTVRLDLTCPRYRKVTDATNYGDGVSAAALLYPNRYVSAGIDERLFTAPLTFEEIVDLTRRCNFNLTEAESRRAFEACAQNDRASIEAFKDAVFQLGL